MKIGMTFLFDSNMCTVTQTISTQNTTQANLEARKYGLLRQSLLEWCFEHLMR